jgi:N-acetylneuraminic acid mutarotase
MQTTKKEDEGSSLTRLQAAFAQLQTVVEGERGRLEADIARLAASRDRLEREVDAMAALRKDWGALVKLNVGGRTFTTSKTTLTRYEESLLGRMFSGRHELATDEEGRAFIDRNGELFEHVLDFLREGPAWVMPDDATLLLRLATEFDYFQLPFNLETHSASSPTAWLTKRGQIDDASPEAAPTTIFAIGGRNDESSSMLAVVERYDPEADAWVSVGQLHSPRNSAAAVAFHGRVFVMGGLSTDTSSVGCFDPSLFISSSSSSSASSKSKAKSKSSKVVSPAQAEGLAGWRALEGLSTVRNGLAGVSLGGRIYALGGHNNAIYLSSVERYDARGDRWERVAEMSTPRYALAAVVLNGRIYAIGGHSGTVPLASVEVYDPTADEWRADVVPDMPTARYYLAAAVLNGRIYVLGGFGEACQAVVECYDPTTNKWTSVAPMSVPKYALAAASVGGKLYALGGFDDKTTFSTVERYDPATNSWSPAANMPTAKYALASVAC